MQVITIIWTAMIGSDSQRITVVKLLKNTTRRMHNSTKNVQHSLYLKNVAIFEYN